MSLPPPPTVRGLSDRLIWVVVALSLAAAWTAIDVGLWFCIPGMAAGLRWPRVLVIVVPLLTGSLAARALDGLEDPPAGELEGRAVLVSDPRPLGAAWRVDLDLSGSRVELRAHGRVAAAVSRLSVGDSALVSASGLGPPADPEWTRPRHVSAEGRLDALDDVGEAGALAGFANGIRDVLWSGASSMEEGERALFAGFVYGDDRRQSKDDREAFRGAGLSHLLAVSGQNVAFVLAVAAPLLARSGPRLKLVLAGGLLIVFGTVTRWEPSVLRAAIMAGLAVGSTVSGRPVRAGRRLGLAVLCVLLLDPLLVESAGFQLSVCASAGIVVLATSLTERLVGPLWFRTALAVTLSAQLGVLGVTVWRFDGVPTASIPANLLAAPAAGPIMVWGMTAGLVAGLLGDPVASFLHLPTRVFVWWVRSVAHWSDGLPLPIIGGGT